MNKHTETGNCWIRNVVYTCKIDGIGNLCDVCHEHDEARGDCSECPPCKACGTE